MDYAAWTYRASQFLRGLTQLPGELEVDDSIEGPATDEHTVNWLRSEKCSLPAQLKEFVGTASTRCCFRYRWKPPEPFLSALVGIYPGCKEIVGGADLCEAARFQNYDNRDWFANFRPGMFGGMSAGIEDPERAHERIAILQLRRDGDSISMNCQEGEGGEIVYVRAGEAAGRILSGSFDEFLTAWERVAYVTPTLENLAPWLDARTGRLQPDHGTAQELRQILREAGERARA